MTGRDRIQALLAGETLDCLPLMPITMMFATDILGKPYRDYVTDYRTLAEAQLCTADAFGLDFVSVISDPAREAADCGAEVEWFADQPPAIHPTNARIASPEVLATLETPDPLGGGRMTDRVRGVEALKTGVGDRRIVEGWIEGPCAEGADLRGLQTLMMDFIERPDFVHALFKFVTNLGLQFAKAQVDAGADLIAIGDAAASLVGPRYYAEYVWPYEKQLVDGIHDMGAYARLHVCGNTTPLLPDIARLGCDIVDLDYMVSVAEARAVLGPDQVLLGNIDPVAMLRNGTPDSILEQLAACHEAAGPRYIVGAGCEVVRDTPHANVHVLRHYARSVTP
jgi:MtaA/CmuA family methyltransferase